MKLKLKLKLIYLYRCFFFLSFVSVPIFALSPVRAENWTWKEGRKDLFLALENTFHASYLQATSTLSLWGLGIGGGALAYSFGQDDRIFKNYGRKGPRGLFRSVDDLAVASTFPLIPLAFYSLGVGEESASKSSKKMRNFALETFSATYLALVESALISFIPIHERPNQTNLSVWETNFRGDSSFPSGHVIPAAVLTFKTFEYYGPYYALIPLSFTTIAGVERIRSGKHYLSDVVGGILLSFFASEGSSRAYENAKEEKSQTYQKISSWSYQILPIVGSNSRSGGFYGGLFSLLF